MIHKVNILIIICETSGSQIDVVPELEKVLKKPSIDYLIKRVKNPTKIASCIKKYRGDIPVVAIYGGDGTVVETMKSLIGSDTKLLILPGGTANVVAQDLGLASTAVEVAKMYADGRYRTVQYDIAQVGGDPFVLDVHSGWWSEAVKDSPPELKKRLGAAAYGITAIKKLPSASRELYEIKVSGRTKKIRGYALLVANQGFQNFLTVPLFPHKHREGMVQVAIIKSLSPIKLGAWFLMNLFTGYAWSGAIRTYRANTIEIIKSPAEVIYDDVSAKLKLPTKIIGGKFHLNVLVPPEPTATPSTTSIRVILVLELHRQIERTRSFFSGKPLFEYSRITPHVYLGGQYRRSAFADFKQWGVTGIINMRSNPTGNFQDDFVHLHLSTGDWRAPDLNLLQKGVDFIQSQLISGGSVYVHCRQGEGRGPTMVAAYLIAQGLSVEQALKHIKKSRPMAHPNRTQVKQLVQWQEHVNALQKSS